MRFVTSVKHKGGEKQIKKERKRGDETPKKLRVQSYKKGELTQSERKAASLGVRNTRDQEKGERRYPRKGKEGEGAIVDGAKGPCRSLGNKNRTGPTGKGDSLGDERGKVGRYEQTRGISPRWLRDDPYTSDSETFLSMQVERQKRR